MSAMRQKAKAVTLAEIPNVDARNVIGLTDAK